MRRPAQRRPVALLAILLSVALHLPLGWWFVQHTFLAEAPPAVPEPLMVTLLDVEPPEPEPEDIEEQPDGQIVEIAPTGKPQEPDKAGYLAEYDSKVDEQTVDPRYRVDREVTAETYSPDDAYELEDQVEMETERPSTGAYTGSLAFKTGRYSLFPDRESRFAMITREGLESPAPSSHTSSKLAGSPSTDYLPELVVADRTALNAHEFLFASWWNRVKRLVSWYASQTLANAYAREPITKVKYELTLRGLVAPDGTLHAIEIGQSCGIKAFDQAIKEAFQLASPFPEPPEGAVEDDGFVHIRDFGFAITISPARAELSGIDPRQNVQFPGLQTVPR